MADQRNLRYQIPQFLFQTRKKLFQRGSGWQISRNLNMRRTPKLPRLKLKNPMRRSSQGM
jgi:hypothetical protein